MSNCGVSDTDSSVEIRLRGGKSVIPLKSKAQLKVETISMEQFARISVPLKDVTVVERQSCVFECQVAVSPVVGQMNYEVLVRWRRDGRDLPEVEKYEYLDETDEQNNVKAQLKIVEADSGQDEGEYSVHFYVLDSGKYVELVKSMAKLCVKEAAVSLVKPLPETLEVNEGDGVELVCVLSKAGLKVKWTKDDREVKSGKSVEMTAYTTSENQHAYKLVMSSASDVKDGSKYKLSFESITTECRILVKAPQLGMCLYLVWCGREQ
jgi:hypothetical protein